ILDGAAARPKDHDFPGRTRLRHRAAVEFGDHAGPHQRGFAAARGSDNRQETGRTQELQQSCSLLLTAEEHVVFVAAEGAETGDRVGPRLGSGIHHSVSFDRRSDVTKPASKAGSKASPACRTTSTETLLKRSLRWLNGGAR